MFRFRVHRPLVLIALVVPHWVSCVERRPVEALPEVEAIDETRPAVIDDFVIIQQTDHSVTLGWHAPGDDGTEGNASAYDLRFSHDSITVGTWTEASPVGSIIRPKSAGAEEFISVSGLLPETTYYFAIRAFDEVGNRSRLSNVARTVTNPLDVQFEEFPIVEGATWAFSVHYEHPITQYEFDTTIVLETSNVLLVDGRPVQASWSWNAPPSDQSGTRTSECSGDTLLFLPVLDDPFILRQLVFPLMVGSHWRVAAGRGERDSAYVAAREWFESERTSRIPVLRIEGESRFSGCISNSTWWVAPNVGLVRVKNRGRLHGCDRDYTWELMDCRIPGE